MNRMKERIGKGLALGGGLLAALAVAAAGCRAPAGRMLDEQGEPLAALDQLYEIVDGAFPGGLEFGVTVKLIEARHSGFDIEENAVLISRSYPPNVARGKVCMGLTHLALHRLSGGDAERKGRCFDNDARFLEYAVAIYVDRMAAGTMEKELAAAHAVAARMIRAGELPVALLRNWEGFCYQGRWADQFEEWNLEGLQALLSLGSFLLQEKHLSLEQLGRVFERLADEEVGLDAAFAAEVGAGLGATLAEWQASVLALVPPERSPRDPESGSIPQGARSQA